MDVSKKSAIKDEASISTIKCTQPFMLVYADEYCRCNESHNRNLPARENESGERPHLKKVQNCHMQQLKEGQYA